ncbi:uncharacterized protein [Clytia hemisphaerica]|uniref:uncharacterized protein n=1 Tax=Clytia hemisphaerica TaxID=252671 RepID=UPI0034D775C6
MTRLANVCSHQYTYHEPHRRIFYEQRAENIVGSCCNVGKNGECLDKDKYCSRTRIYTVSVSKLRLIKRYKTKYYCCKGFHQEDDACVKVPNHQMGVMKEKFYILLIITVTIGIATLILLCLCKYKHCRQVTLPCRRSDVAMVNKEKVLTKLPAADMMTHTTVAIGADRMSS